jgi:hypothetical protein
VAAATFAGRMKSDFRDVTRSQSLTRTYFSSSGMTMLKVVPFDIGGGSEEEVSKRLLFVPDVRVRRGVDVPDADADAGAETSSSLAPPPTPPGSSEVAERFCLLAELEEDWAPAGDGF